MEWSSLAKAHVSAIVAEVVMALGEEGVEGTDLLQRTPAGVVGGKDEVMVVVGDVLGTGGGGQEEKLALLDLRKGEATEKDVVTMTWMEPWRGWRMAVVRAGKGVVGLGAKVGEVADNRPRFGIRRRRVHKSRMPHHKKTLPNHQKSLSHLVIPREEEMTKLKKQSFIKNKKSTSGYSIWSKMT